MGVVETGSAVVLVTVSQDGALLDRRRLELVDAGLSSHPHHHEGSWAVGRYLDTPGARRMSLQDAVALVDRVRASAEENARAGLAALAADVATPIARVALRACPALPPTTEERIVDHRAQTYADSVMYRQIVAAAAEARGWAVRWYDRDVVRDEAARAVDDLDALLATMGKTAGPPWQAQHKRAAAAALVATRA